MKKTTSDVGLNRTGIQTSPIDSKEAIEGARVGLPSSAGTEVGIAEVRIAYAKESDGLGIGARAGHAQGHVHHREGAAQGHQAHGVHRQAGRAGSASSAPG